MPRLFDIEITSIQISQSTNKYCLYGPRQFNIVRCCCYVVPCFISIIFNHPRLSPSSVTKELVSTYYCESSSEVMLLLYFQTSTNKYCMYNPRQFITCKILSLYYTFFYFHYFQSSKVTPMSSNKRAVQYCEFSPELIFLPYIQT